MSEEIKSIAGHSSYSPVMPLHASASTSTRSYPRLSIAVVLAMLAALLISVNAGPAQAATCPSGATTLTGTNPLVCEIRFTADTSWTVPAGIFQVDAVVVGGGGSGSTGLAIDKPGDPAKPGDLRAVAGNGGGGGSVEFGAGISLTPGATVNVEVGGGGAAVTGAGTAGNPGEQSQFGTFLTATGGQGGFAGVVTGDARGGGSGSFQGGSTAHVATLLDSGSPRIPENDRYYFFGGGGAGAAANGQNATTTSNNQGPANDAAGGNGGSGASPTGGLFAVVFSDTFGGGGGGGRVSNGRAGLGGAGGGGGYVFQKPLELDGAVNTGGGGAGGRTNDINSIPDVSHKGGSGIVIIRFLATQTPPAPSPALTPAFDTPVSTADGFTVNVTNYDSAYAWTESVDAGSVSAGTASGSTLPLTVTGLSAGASATITVNTTQTGYNSGSATVTGQATAAPGPNPGPNPPAPGPVAPAEPTTPGASSGSGASGSGATSAPVSLPAAASPGGAAGLVGGQPAAVTVELLAGANSPAVGGSAASTLPPRLQQELPATNGSQLTVGDTTIAVTGPQVGGSLNGSSLAIAPGAPVDLALSGFQAGTEVGIFVISADGTAILIGTAFVGADGVVRSVITVSTDAASGSGRLQIQGTNSSGASFAVALDTEILAPVAPVPTSSGALPEVRPGGAVVLNAQGEPLRATVEQVNGTDIRIRTQQSTSNIQAVDSGGVRALGAQGAIEVSESGFVRVGGSGFQPGSTVQVWMFSDPSFVGVVKADASGNYVSLLQLPESLKPGAHTLQSAGTARNGVKIAASAGLRVTSAESGSGASGNTSKSKRVTATIYFDPMSSHLDSSDRKRLDALVARVGKRSANVTVTGYVQASSNPSNDKTLSAARAQAVAKYLRSQGVRGKYIVTGEGVLNRPAAQARSARVVVTFSR